MWVRKPDLVSDLLRLHRVQRRSSTASPLTGTAAGLKCAHSNSPSRACGRSGLPSPSTSPAGPCRNRRRHGGREVFNPGSDHLRLVRAGDVYGAGEPGADERHIDPSEGRAPVPGVRRKWEVVRTLRRAGDGAVGQPNAQLRRFGADEETVEQVEQVRRVNDRVKDLIGLDSNAFLRTVILPQGRFARLLVEDEPRGPEPDPASGLAHRRA